MNATRVRLALVEQGRRLVDLHRETGIPYNRLIRITNGYFEARREEIRSIATALGLDESELLDPAEDP